MSVRRNRVLAVGVIAAVHLLGTVVCLVFSIGETMARFDARPVGIAGSVASFLLPILTAPLLPLVEISSFRFPGALGYLPFVANSGLWSIAIVWGIGRFRNKEPNRPPQRNAGSRPSSDDSPATETPSSLGPRR